jgi:hypothetical protein
MDVVLASQRHCSGLRPAGLSLMKQSRWNTARRYCALVKQPQLGTDTTLHIKLVVCFLEVSWKSCL